MTPDQIKALTDIAMVISKISTWPIGSIAIIVICGPYFIMSFWMRAIEKRFDAAQEMYKSNVKLVECYEKIAADQADTIRLSTGATTELITYLKNRIPCYQRIAEKFRPL